MNHIYKVVFNRSLGQSQAVPECARRAGKTAGRRRTQGLGAIALTALIGVAPAPAATYDLATSDGTDGAVDSGQSGTAAVAPVTTDSDTYNLILGNSLTGGDGAKGVGSASGVSGNGGNGGAGIEVDGASNTFNFAGSITGGAAGGGGQGLWGSSTGGFPGTAANAIQVDGANNSFNITGAMTGGRGGNGGFGGTSRNGGNGAAAIGVNGTGNTISVDGATVAGGNGGDRGNLGYAGGTGGVAVQLNGSGNRLITSGALNGGSPGVGSTAVANAVQVGGTGNTVELRDGYSFGGDVVVQSGSHTLALGGTTDASFDSALMAGTQPGSDGTTQFVGFSNLEKTGASTWTLTGTRGDSGTTTISQGELIADAAALGSGNITNNATLTLEQTADATYSGVMSGSGDFAKNGAGTLTLTGANTFSGTTTVSAGALAIGSGGTTGSFSGNITNNAAVQFNRSDALTYGGNISGTGSLTQSGTGTTTLTGTNTYSGATTIDAGTLAVQGGSAISDGSAVSIASGATLSLGADEAIGTLSGAGDIALNANTLTVDESLSYSFTGGISGTGGLVKTGSADLTLSGTNTYTGTTTIDDGQINVYGGAAIADTSAVVVGSGTRLYVGADETIGSLAGAGEVMLGFSATTPTLTVGGDNTSTTFTGQIVGPGGLTKTGTGTQTLGGVNSDYSGATNIEAGTLVVSGETAVGDGSAVTVASGATLELASNESVGSLAGAGAVDLGANTLTAGFNHNSTTFSGVMDGTGGYTKTGNGTLTLTGANTYSGDTTISTGTLALGNGGTGGSVSGNITNNGALQFNRIDDITVSNTITGTGSLTQSGTGTLTLSDSGAFGYTGATIVESGTLVVNGALDSSAVTVEADATLMGNGVINSLHINDGATLAVGNSIGAMAVTNNAVFDSGSVYQVEADANGDVDVLTVGGVATINGGTVDVQASDVGQWSATTDYTIIATGGGVTGEFDAVTSNLAFLTPTLSYDADNVMLNLTRNDIAFREFGDKAPETAVADKLETLYANDPDALNGFFADFIALSDADARQALRTLNGSSLAGLAKRAGRSRALSVAQHLSRMGTTTQLQASRDSQPIYLVSNEPSVDAAAIQGMQARGQLQQTGIWLQGIGGQGSVDDSTQIYGYDTDVSGAAAGFDIILRNGVQMGFSLAHIKQDTEVDQINDSQEISSNYLSVYAQQQLDQLHLSGAFGFGSSSIDTRRDIVIGSTTLHATGDTDGSDIFGYAEAAYDLTRSGNFTLQPVAGLAVAQTIVSDFFEQGAGALNLQVEEQKRTSAETKLGGRLVYGDAAGKLSAQAYLLWGHELADVNNDVQIAFAAEPASGYWVQDEDRNRDSASWGGHVAYAASNRLSVNAGVSGEQSSAEQEVIGSVGVRYHW